MTHSEAVAAQYSEAQINEMRHWLADCEWRDCDSDEIYDLAPWQIVRAVETHYDGGLDNFDLDGIA